MTREGAVKRLKGKDLDAEIKKYTERLYNETFGNGQGTLDEFDWEDIASVIEDTAKHFAEWQKKLDDLETADLLAIAHLQGMEQQKAKMLEGAVEGTIVCYPDKTYSVESCLFDNKEHHKSGDKVKLIIVKEDEK